MKPRTSDQSQNSFLRITFSGIFSLLLFIFSTQNGKAQLNVNTGYTAGQVMTQLVGPGVQPSNVVLNCPNGSYGYFSNGVTTNLGLTDGIVLSTGLASAVIGPNISPATTTVTNGIANHPLMNQIAGTNTFDGCILEFDLIPTCDTIELKFVFGSEEYMEWVGSFNDAFAFFISGPGIVGNQNIALIPGTAIPVTINNVNLGANPAWYVDNPGGTTIECDGFTLPMLARAAVIPCSTYHLTLGVADAIDQAYDSNVFLESFGLQCSANDFQVNAIQDGHEGCQNGIFEFIRTGNIGTAATLTYMIGGTATNGTDYTMIGTTMTFPAGVATQNLTIFPVADLIPEGTETVMIILADTACGTIMYDTTIISIFDPPLPDAGPDQTICAATTTQIGTPGNVGSTYLWNPSADLNNATLAQPTANGNNPTNNPVVVNYTVTETDAYGCTGTDDMNLTINPIPVSSFILQDSICSGTQTTITFNGVAAAGAVYTWTFTGSPATVGTGAGPIQATWNTAGLYTVTLQVSVGPCSSAVYSQNIMILENPVVGIDPVADQCFNGNSFDFNLNGTYTPGAANYLWTFGPDATPIGSSQENPTGIVFSTAGFKQATVQVNQYGCVSNIAILNFTVNPMPDASWVNNSGQLCFNGNAYSFSPVTTGPGVGYAWTFQNGIPATSTVPNPTVSFTQAGLNQVTLIVNVSGCMDTVSGFITVLPNPIVDAGPNVSFCSGEGGAQLTGFGTSGTAPYYWTWWCDSTNTWCGLDSVFDDDPFANPNVTAMYYTQIIDFNGCPSNIDSALVTVLPKPVADAGPDVWICTRPAPCELLTPSVTGSPGPFAFQWTPAAGLNSDTLANPCARPDTTTIYTLYVTDIITGCTSTANALDSVSTVTVHVNPLPIADAGPDKDICFGQSTMLQGIGYNAGPLYGFEWSPAVGLSSTTIANPIANPSMTIDYILTTWSNDCPSIGDTITVRVHVNPTADAGPDIDICIGETAQLSGSVFGDSTAAFYTYLWTPPTGIIGSNTVDDPNVSPVVTTTYYFVSTSSWGCQSPMDSMLLTVKPGPMAEAGISQSICMGDSILLNGGYYYTTQDTVSDPTQIVYTWTPNSTITNNTIQDPTVWPTQTMYYYIQVNYNTCSTIDSVLITVNPVPDATVWADTTAICETDSVQLHAGGGLGGATYTWSPSAGLNNSNISNPMAAPSATTTYVVTVSEGQCSDKASVTIEVLDRPSAGYLSSLGQGCVPFSVSFLELADDDLSWVWNFGDGTISNDPNPIHTYDLPGSYTVILTVLGQGACEDRVDNMTIVVHDTVHANFTSNPEYPVTLSLPNTTVTFKDQSLNAVTWNWIFGDGITSSETNPIHTYMDEGTFMVTLQATNDFGCVTEVTHGPYIVMNPEVFIPNVFSPNDDNINDVFLVKYTGSQPFLLEMFDRWGNKVFSQRDKHTGWDGKVGSQLSPDGEYYYVVKIGDKGYAGYVTLVR